MNKLAINTVEKSVDELAHVEVALLVKTGLNVVTEAQRAKEDAEFDEWLDAVSPTTSEDTSPAMLLGSSPDATKQGRPPLEPKAPSSSVALRADAPIFPPPKHVAAPSCQPQPSNQQAQASHAPPPSSQLEFAPPPPSAAFSPPAHAYRPSPPTYAPPCFMPPGFMVAPPLPPPHHQQPHQHHHPHPSPAEEVATRWQQQLRLRDSWYDHAHERGGPWSPAMPAQGSLLRIDPSDGHAYPIEAFVAHYKGTAEWDAAWPVPQVQLQRVAAFPAARPAHHLAHSRDARQSAELQAAVMHGHKEKANSGRQGDPRWRYTYNGVVYITDATSRYEITRHRLRPHNSNSSNVNFKSPHRSPRSSPASCSSPSTSPRTQALSPAHPVSGDRRHTAGRSRSRLAQADDTQPRRLDYSSLSPAPPTDEHHQLLAAVAAKERENAAAMHKAQLELQTARARVRMTTTNLVVAQSQAGVNEFLGLRQKDAPDVPTAEPAAVLPPAADRTSDRTLASPTDATAVVAAVDGALTCPADASVDLLPTQLTDDGADQEVALRSRTDQAEAAAAAAAAKQAKQAGKESWEAVQPVSAATLRKQALWRAHRQAMAREPAWAAELLQNAWPTPLQQAQSVEAKPSALASQQQKSHVPTYQQQRQQQQAQAQAQAQTQAQAQQ